MSQGMLEKPHGLEVFDGHHWDYIQEDIRTLYRISKILRAQRFENGSLKLDNVHLQVKLDDTGRPESFAPYQVVSHF